MLKPHTPVFASPENEYRAWAEWGLGFRDFAAVHALAGVLASDHGGDLKPIEAADLAVDCVDALIVRLNKERPDA